MRFARAKLDMKERHYKEFAEALRQFSPKHAGIAQAEAAAAELKEVRRKLDQQRAEFEEQMKKEKKRNCFIGFIKALGKIDKGYSN